jgi:hypothetical protein
MGGQPLVPFARVGQRLGARPLGGGQARCLALKGRQRWP